jgi:hypothetical protein
MNDQEQQAYYRGCIVALCASGCLWLVLLALLGVI